MSEVQFDNENDFQFKSRSVLGDYQKPGLVSWLQKKGIVKDDKWARYILVAIIVLCFGLAFFIFAGGFDIFSGNENNNSAELTPLEIQRMSDAEKELYENTIK